MSDIEERIEVIEKRLDNLETIVAQMFKETDFYKDRTTAYRRYDDDS